MIGPILLLALGIFQFITGMIGIEHVWGAWGLIIVLIITGITGIEFPFTLGTYYCCTLVLRWHWIPSLCVAAPGLALCCFFLFTGNCGGFSVFSRLFSAFSRLWNRSTKSRNATIEFQMPVPSQNALPSAPYNSLPHECRLPELPLPIAHATVMPAQPFSWDARAIDGKTTARAQSDYPPDSAYSWWKWFALCSIVAMGVLVYISSVSAQSPRASMLTYGDHGVVQFEQPQKSPVSNKERAPNNPPVRSTREKMHGKQQEGRARKMHTTASASYESIIEVPKIPDSWHVVADDDKLPARKSKITPPAEKTSYKREMVVDEITLGSVSILIPMPFIGFQKKKPVRDFMEIPGSGRMNVRQYYEYVTPNKIILAYLYVMSSSLHDDEYFSDSDFTELMIASRVQEKYAMKELGEYINKSMGFNDPPPTHFIPREIFANANSRGIYHEAESTHNGITGYSTESVVVMKVKGKVFCLVYGIIAPMRNERMSEMVTSGTKNWSELILDYNK